MNRTQCDIIASMFDIELPFVIFWAIAAVCFIMGVR
jgi:hypothetical protein